jgi:chaperone LolA
MKKIILLFTIVAGFVCTAKAQKDAEAKAILAQVSKKYRSYDVVKADFSFTMENPQAKAKETQQGILYVQSKSNKYKVALTNQEMISDGKTLWTYLKEEKEVQLTNVDHSADALNPARIFTIYETGYKYIYNGEQKSGGKTYQVIDLTPIDISKTIFKIRLNIDKGSKQISSAQVFEKSGNKYSYTIKSIVPNAKVPAGIFAFDAKKYPGVEVVDLR